MNAIEAYASATSVFPGENISFHVRTAPPHFYFQIDIYRKGKEENLVHRGSGTAAAYPTPANASEIGCGWPSAYTLTIPDDWRSGVYIARLTSLGATTDILFVVKAAAPGTNSKILFQLTVTTYEAYNNWGGKSLYGYHSTEGVESNKVSFNRPGQLTADTNFYQYEYDFVRWLEDNGFEVEYGTSIDLHADPDFLDNYQLLLSVGHDEYWSREMRDNVEAFIANGGNVAFFSGNVCWWQVRFEDGNRTMVCYRDANEDPMTGVDDSQVTVLWREAPVNRPENHMTGVSFANGAGWFGEKTTNRPAVGYRVHFGGHWVFYTTGLNEGDEFGAEDSIVGYEVDAAQFVENNGVPQVTGQDGTPLNFIVLASADCTNWGPDGGFGPGGQSGLATMGIYRRKGVVFTAATTDWSHGLRGSWNAVSQITQNILRRLSCPCPPSPYIANCGFEKWAQDAHPDDWHLEGQGEVRADQAAARNGKYGLVVDATNGQTWISQGPFACEGRNYYRVGCWAWSDCPGATIRLQSTDTWRDFAIAEHSGSGQWEYLCAVGKVDDEGPMFPARVKIQVAAGMVASFDNVDVEAL